VLIKLRQSPARRANEEMMARWISVHVLPNNRSKIVRLAPLSAGPTIRKISAAPGEMPLAIKLSATGMEAVLQTYIGIPIRSITGKATQSFPRNVLLKKSLGIRIEMRAEIMIPIRSAQATFPRSIP
jgi:hypothetical protein